MIEIFPLQIYSGAAQVFCHLFCKIQSGGSACIFIEEFCQFPVEYRIIFIVVVRVFQFDDCIHQCFGDILPAVDAEASVWIRHDLPSFLTACTNAVIFILSFCPSVSTPELTSTA